MISVNGLYHSYSHDEKYAVKDVSFEIAEGEVFGFLGPSGAGKSTTQGVLTGLLPLQRGSVAVAGFDVRKPSRRMFNKLGVSFEQSNVYGKLTALENLEFYRRLFDVPTRDPKELLEIVGLDGVATQRASEFSKGMKHRLTFARSMLNSPEMWFLDEPTTGLDPQSRHQVWERLDALKSKGLSSLLTTHYMDEASRLCDRLVIIDRGKILVLGKPSDLIRDYVGQNVIEVAEPSTELGKFVRAEGVDHEDLGHRLIIYGEESEELFHAISSKYCDEGCVLRMATLEDVFLKLTGRGLRE